MVTSVPVANLNLQRTPTGTLGFKTASPRLLLGLFLVPTAMGISVLCQWPALHLHQPYVLINVGVTALLVSAGIYISARDGMRTYGALLAVCGLLWSLQLVTTWQTGPWPLLGGAFSDVFFAVGIYGSLQYPSTLRKNRLELAAIIFLLTFDILNQLAVSIATRNATFGFTRAWWLTWPWLNRHQAAFLNIESVIQIFLATVFAIAVVSRYRRMSRLDRQAFAPIAGATNLVGIISAVGASDAFFPTLNGFIETEAITVACIAVGVVSMVIWQQRTHAHVAEFLYQEFASRPNSTASVTAALRSALKDPSLEIQYWSNSRAHFVDHFGHMQPHNPERFTGTLAKDGTPMARIVGDISLSHHPRVVSTALNASQIALENARLHSEVLRQLDEVQTSRHRVAQAAFDERRRIEQDVHDGIQQRLLAISLRLATLKLSMPTEELKTSLDEHMNAISAVNQELRDLVNGVYPTNLRQFGLRTAISELVTDYSLNISTDVTAERFQPLIEATLYFATSELLSNLVKHAHATEAQVSISREPSCITLQIHDNGIGGATESGKGLIGLRDRVQAIGGTLEISSETGIGTAVIARIPST